jgi:hypothetical protein
MLRSLQDRVEAQTQRAVQLSVQLEAAAVTVRSTGGEVTVRVNSAGGLAGLQFHPEADRLSRDELARIVLHTSGQAQGQLAKQVGELVAHVYGSDSGTAAFIADAYASRYPAPDDLETR